MNILLSTSTMPLVRYIAHLLGWLMNGIFEVLSKIGLPNIGVAIIIFTIIIYLILTPIQYKTQKSSKIMAALNPELQKIQAKYKGKRDQVSMQKMQMETQALYRQYGVSMAGSCLPMLIQLPLLFAVYQVILHMPGYIGKIGHVFEGLATKMMGVAGAQEALTTFVSENSVRVRMPDELTTEGVIDFLYALKPSNWTALQNTGTFSSLSKDIADVATQSHKMNSFLGINIAEAPWDAIKSGFNGIRTGQVSAGLILALFIGLAIPVLAWFTQWLNYKLMPQSAANANKENAMASQLNSMNTIMPLFSAFICLTLSMGIGIYWIVGAVIRCVQQVVINRKIGKIDTEAIRQQISDDRRNALAEENRKEREKKAAKRAAASGSYNDVRGARAKNLPSTEELLNREMKDVHPDSLTAKANMVRSLDSRTGKKK